MVPQDHCQCIKGTCDALSATARWLRANFRNTFISTWLRPIVFGFLISYCHAAGTRQCSNTRRDRAHLGSLSQVANTIYITRVCMHDVQDAVRVFQSHNRSDRSPQFNETPRLKQSVKQPIASLVRLPLLCLCLKTFTSVNPKEENESA
jgi:hypothetical protein